MKTLIHIILKSIFQLDTVNDLKINPLVKSLVLYVIGIFIGQGCTFLGTIIFTRVMPQAAYGEYATYYSIVSILVVLVGNNLYVPIDNAYMDYKKQIHAFRKSILWLSTLIFFAVAIVILLLSFFFGIPMSLFFMTFSLIHAYGFFVINYRMQSANMEGDYKCRLTLLILPNLFQLILALLLIMIFNNNPIEARVIGSSLGIFICAIIAYIGMIKEQGKLYVLEYWKYALKISCPSIPMSVSYMLMQQCDKVMITNICGPEYTAVYTVIYYIGYIVIAINQGVSPVWQAWIYRMLDKGELLFVKQVQKWYLVIFAALITGLLMFAPEFIQIIAPESYWNYRLAVPFILSGSMMILYGFYTTVGLFYKKSGQVSICVLIATVINIVLNKILIPVFGADVAAYTTAIAYFVLYFLAQMVVKRRIKDLFSEKLFGIFMAYVFLLSIIFLKVYGSLFKRMVMFGIALILLVRYFWIRRNEIKEIIIL